MRGEKFFEFTLIDGNGVVSEAWLRTLTKNQQYKINL